MADKQRIEIPGRRLRLHADDYYAFGADRGGWFPCTFFGLHAPGSLLTYEPQRALDVFAMFRNIVWEACTPRELLTNNVPESRREDPDFYAHRFQENRIVCKFEYFAAEGLTVLPGRTARIRNEGAYGAIAVQGHGTLGALEIEAA